METKESLIEPLIERVEQYGKTNFELLKLKSLDKMADVTSTFIARLVLAGIFFLFILTLTIAAGLWIGSMLGETYYGFFIVAAFYALTGILVFFIHPVIKARINNRIITQILN